MSVRWCPVLLYIVLATSRQEVHSAFEAVSEVQPSSPRNNNIKCGGRLTERNGIIQTPDFPAAFETPLSCTWIIDASAHFTGGVADNTSIVVYLTQLYVVTGLKFTGYLVYDDTFDLRIKSEESFDLQEEDVTQVMWLKFSTKYLEIQFTIDTVYGTHLRALERFLDVYGFNITYEIGSVKPMQCNALKCRFLGHCYAAQDFRCAPSSLLSIPSLSLKTEFPHLQ